MQHLKLRECQKPMIAAMTNQNRMNIFASPGTGKTSAVLYSLVANQAIDGDVWPVLVAAPKRVANTVWTNETAKWEQFKHLKVVSLTGTQSERIAGLRTPAHIYVINYENLKWLAQEKGRGPWGFNTIVIDESTRIKNHRCSLRSTDKVGGVGLHAQGGSLNAREIVLQAPNVKRWFNLSGTPTPNGLKDLWGQQFPIDLGFSLGRAYSHFADRWFKPVYGSTPEQQRIEPLKDTEAEITKLLKPYSVVVDAYDYFDIDKPIEIDRFIELPKKVRALYKKVHEESVAELEALDTKVTAVNMGAKVMKCRQLSSGFIKDDASDWHELHKEKIEAVKELTESLNGQPLIVAYWFQEDLRMLQEAFPKAVLLPSDAKKQAKVEKDWNDGKIEMLLLHPQSAGHGLSLQYGGNNICIYTLDWNSEYYDQVIERLGPTRQAQAGFKRAVYVYRIIASKTWDEIIAKRLNGKLEISDAFKEAIKLME